MASPDDFETSTAGHLLLFKTGHDDKAIRLELPDLSLEFTDNLYIGTGMSSSCVDEVNCR